eukprot:6745429-Pyramimonas_sp.AAC.2
MGVRSLKRPYWTTTTTGTTATRAARRRAARALRVDDPQLRLLRPNNGAFEPRRGAPGLGLAGLSVSANELAGEKAEKSLGNTSTGDGGSTSGVGRRAAPRGSDEK